MDEKDLISKTIEKIDIDGYGIEIRFTDGTEFVYNASDAGYSSWDISKETPQPHPCKECNKYGYDVHCPYYGK